MPKGRYRARGSTRSNRAAGSRRLSRSPTRSTPRRRRSSPRSRWRGRTRSSRRRVATRRRGRRMTRSDASVRKPTRGSVRRENAPRPPSSTPCPTPCPTAETSTTSASARGRTRETTSSASFDRCAVSGGRAFGSPATSTRASSRAGSSPCSPRRSARITRSAAPPSSRLRNRPRRRRSPRRRCRDTTRRPRGLDPRTTSPPRSTDRSPYPRLAPRGASRRRFAEPTAPPPRGQCTRRRWAPPPACWVKRTGASAPCFRRRPSYRGSSGVWRRRTLWRGRDWTSRAASLRRRGGVWRRRTPRRRERCSAGRLLSGSTGSITSRASCSSPWTTGGNWRGRARRTPRLSTPSAPRRSPG